MRINIDQLNNQNQQLKQQLEVLQQNNENQFNKYMELQKNYDQLF